MKTRRELLGGLIALPSLATGKTLRILVLCTGNSARSQMTEGFLKSFDKRLEVYSAGTNPSARVNPFAIAAMKELGLDISGGTPKNAKQFVGESFDYVITVCDDADKNCPNFSGKVGKRLHIGFIDPAKATGTDDEKMAIFRKVRDEIREKFTALYKSDISKKLA
ncbi:MAG: arsenate reductase ArsC [Acidobacteria bacterium]|nr:arsenate reductase ArsC [Acidobacteriota bacterium]